MSFVNKKVDLLKCTQDLILELNNILNKKDIIKKYDKILKEFLMKYANYDVENIIKNLKDCLNMVERSTMKCVFIGNTSNGKSCTINAILKQNILPSDSGRTTSCLVNIMGYKGHKIYFKDTHGKECPVDDFQKLVDQLSDQPRSVDSLLSVFIPRNMCELLKNDVEIVDCPGVDYDPNQDAAIVSHCKNSDVFVLVVNGEATLNESEKTLLRKLKGHLSNVIIVINKWDLIEKGKTERVEKLRKQHQNEIEKFLVDDLKMYLLPEARKRIFFISSFREVERIGSDNNPNPEFKRFKDALIEYSNEHAIEFKIKKFHQDVQQKKKLTLEYLLDLTNFVIRSKTFDYDTMKKQMINDSKNNILRTFKNNDQEFKKLRDNIVSKLVSTNNKTMGTKVIDDGNDVLNFRNYFVNNMKSLLDQIKGICAQHSCINMDGDKMERFSKLLTDLDKLIEEYEDIEDVNNHLSLKLKEASKEQKNKNKFIPVVTSVLKLLSPIFAIGGFIARLVNPAIAILISIGGPLFLTGFETLAEKISEMNFEDQIKSCVEIFFSAIQMNLQKLHKSIDDAVMDCVNEFIEDQRHMDDLLMTFDKLRVKIEEIST